MKSGGMTDELNLFWNTCNLTSLIPISFQPIISWPFRIFLIIYQSVFYCWFHISITFNQHPFFAAFVTIIPAVILTKIFHTRSCGHFLYNTFMSNFAPRTDSMSIINTSCSHQIKFWNYSYCYYEVLWSMLCEDSKRVVLALGNCQNWLK